MQRNSREERDNRRKNGEFSYLSESPYFYIICKRCGSNRMFFSSTGKAYAPNDYGLDIELCCDSCGETNGLRDYCDIEIEEN